MKKYYLYILSMIIILTVATSCTTTSQLYSYYDKNRTYTGKLSEPDFISLHHFLVKYSTPKLTDTVIIKYDYNNETCWRVLDRSDDARIMSFVIFKQERIQKMAATRQNVSIFEFREPGNQLNKIKKWDNSIIIDSSKQLFNLLFKERCTCGSSIMIMPNKQFVFLRSDSHSEIFDLKQKEIETILGKK